MSRSELPLFRAGRAARRGFADAHANMTGRPMAKREAETHDAANAARTSTTRICWPAGAASCSAEGNAQLPLPPMLMFDRISEIAEAGGEYGKGLVRAELDVKPDLWFFDCHFKGDPVMPGCLGLDALWQLLGFFLGWLGIPGSGRALGVGEVKFSGQVLPSVKNVVYGIDFKRVMRSKLVLGIADGWLSADGERIYRGARICKVGSVQAPTRRPPEAVTACMSA